MGINNHFLWSAAIVNNDCSIRVYPSGHVDKHFLCVKVTVK